MRVCACVCVCVCVCVRASTCLYSIALWVSGCLCRTFEGLLSVLAETVAGTKHEDLVVQALRNHVLAWHYGHHQAEQTVGCQWRLETQQETHTHPFPSLCLCPPPQICLIPLGCTATEGMECMEGSAMYLMSTGMSHSHTRMLLSSEVVTMRRPSSTNVIVLTAPRWLRSPPKNRKEAQGRKVQCVCVCLCVCVCVCVPVSASVCVCLSVCLSV